MTGQVEVRYQSLGECLIVRVAGDVDASGAGVLRDALIGKVGAGDIRLVVDLTRVSAMDAEGLSSLLAAAHEAESSGGSLRLVGITPSVRNAMRTAKVAGALLVDD